jgi:hypothetical protein
MTPNAPKLASDPVIAAIFSPVIPSGARDLQFLYNAARSGSATPQHSRGTACRARSRHPLKSAIEGSFASARLALVILSGAKDPNCQ